MPGRLDPESRGPATGGGVRTWLCRIGLAGCLFFMVKGLAWIVVAMLAGYGLSNS
jgi:hypothetical protein